MTGPSTCRVVGCAPCSADWPCDVGRAVPPRVLIEALWPDDAPGDPANALQSLVSRLRRTLGDPTLVEQVPGGYRLNLAPDDVDAVRFARLAGQGRAQLGAGSIVEAAATLREALALWRGEPLPDDESLEAEAVRARLADLQLQAWADRIEADLTAVREGGTDLGEVVAELEALVAEHPLREDLAALRMRALVAVGRPAEALAAYEKTRAYLADSLGSDPSPALQQAHLAILRLQDAGPVSRQTNLRAALTSFVGRDADAGRVDALLSGRSRLVTIVGTGGAGKTRLASEVAAGWVGRVPDGVWFAELAPVTDPANIAVAVLDGLDIREVAFDRVERTEWPQLTARERVLRSLADSCCLVVIDNCEHVVDAVAGLVAEVLGQCPGVLIIATSREPLGIDGETLYPLTPLGLPADGDLPADVAGTAAVRLLVDRARSVGADLTLDEETVADVIEVVRRLDGLPLAIELAAARLRVLSIAEVASRLGDRFRLLTGGRRTAMPRHRTLRAVVEWSWELLTPLEREVAEHFSVFGSGATVAAVAAVVPGQSSQSGRTAALEDVLAALVDKSLLVAGQDAGEARFRMLETLREYGTERLGEAGTLEAARLAHARYFLGLVEEADAGLRTKQQIGWLRRLDAERDNALTALAYLGEHGHAEAVLRMAVALSWFWMLRENGKDSARWLRFALDVPGAEGQPFYVLAESMQIVSAFATPSDPGGDTGRQGQLRDLADRLEVAAGLHPLVSIIRPALYFFGEDRGRAEQLASESLSTGDLWTRAATRTLLTMFRENDGNVEGMREELELGFAEWQELGDHWGTAAILSSRGQLRTLDGDVEGAALDFEEALHHLRQLGNRVEDVQVNMSLADLRLRAGDFEGARRYADLVAASDDEGLGGHGEIGTILGDILLGTIAYEQGDRPALDACRTRLLGTIEVLGEPSHFMSHGLAVAHGFLASMAAQAGQLDVARLHVDEGVRQGLRTRDLPLIAAVGVSVARYTFVVGRHRQAAVLLGAMAQLRGSDDITATAIRALSRDLQAALGDDYAVAYAEGRALGRDDALARLDPALLD